MRLVKGGRAFAKGTALLQSGTCEGAAAQYADRPAGCLGLLFELASLALTDPSGRGDFHGDVESVRQGNMEDPHRKIYNGGRAVARA